MDTHSDAEVCVCVGVTGGVVERSLKRMFYKLSSLRSHQEATSGSEK